MMLKFEQLQASDEALGLSVSKGWRHTLLHHGTSRKEVYKAMYGQLVYGSGVAKPGTTVVYPELVQEMGKHISLEVMAKHCWQGPPKSCSYCFEAKTNKKGDEKKYKPY